MGMLGSPKQRSKSQQGAARQVNSKQKLQQHSRRLSGCFPPRRHSESLLMSYLQMQADGIDHGHGANEAAHTGPKQPCNPAHAEATKAVSKPKPQSMLATTASKSHQGNKHSRQSRVASLAGHLGHPYDCFKKTAGRRKKLPESRHVLPLGCPRLHCCGVPVHLLLAFAMGLGLLAVLGVFLALPLYVYLGRLQHMQC